jgi:hypothetical protein
MPKKSAELISVGNKVLVANISQEISVAVQYACHKLNGPAGLRACPSG